MELEPFFYLEFGFQVLMVFTINFETCSCLMQVGVVSDYDLLALDSISGII